MRFLPGSHEAALEAKDSHQRPGRANGLTATPRVDDQTTVIEFLQRGAGNQAVSRLLSPAGRVSSAGHTSPIGAGVASAVHPSGTAHALEDDGLAGTEKFTPKPINVGSAGPDTSPPPMNDQGFIDGEWASEVAATVFVNAGKAGSGMVNWAGGNGGTTPGIGGFTAVAPTIDTRAAGDAGTASAWVRTGTGTVTVRRHFFGVPVGANATYFITAAAAARIDTHEQNHIAHSRMAHDALIAPLETRVAARTGEAAALSQGADEAAVRAALEAALNWNGSLTAFRNQDNTYNLPGGSVDTDDSASAGWYRDLGPRTVGGVNFDHYVDV